MSRMIFAAAFFVLLSLPMPPATAQQQVPGGSTVTVAVGTPSPVYGVRSRDCNAAPSFEAIDCTSPQATLLDITCTGSPVAGDCHGRHRPTA